MEELVLFYLKSAETGVTLPQPSLGISSSNQLVLILWAVEKAEHVLWVP